ncbi:MAG TPA: polysaccharide deacetylase family protein [Candidatus Limnocylindria bacterium]|nr:polysaccharide deacetylase family protein [Candidatus Limnocylindria bacterium]
MTVRSSRPDGARATLESPWLAAGLVAVVMALIAAILLVPGLIGSGGPGASSRASGPPAPTAAPTDPAPTFLRPTPSPQPSFSSYVVRPGDTLSSIARTYDTTARSIAWWNRGTYPILDPESESYDPNHLELGWVLVLLPGTEVDENNPPTPSPGPNATPGLTPPSVTPPPTLPPTGTTPPSPSPRPTRTPAPTPKPTPKPTAAPASATVVSHGPRTVQNIALTFDMGGRLDPAVQIVQWLIDHDVHASLFPTGASATTTTRGLQVMQLAATRPDLFDIGNHSWNHPDFRDLTAAEMADQLIRTQAALLPICGTTKPWFRPPYGGWNEAVRAGVGAAGWRTMVMWDVDMIDWRPEADGGPTAADMAAKLQANARGGSIVLMHLGGYNTLEALPGVLAAAGDLGLEPVTLTEMLGS